MKRMRHYGVKLFPEGVYGIASGAGTMTIHEARAKAARLNVEKSGSEIEREKSPLWVVWAEVCPTCGGQDRGEKCPDCAGTGQVEERVNLADAMIYDGIAEALIEVVKNG